ncbi:Fpg/Nei family DNA glycosylase [Peribacillus glennii]|uniref:Formamidopyrimidine-DNA glycosylase n=1 Tax=Peribacillus glennii TaxID=2303991 RepID=A0A372LEM0_9BACI|nr:DNA-formamidopyrimidine glycosylase family protein [Peribacillus glennii]RFU64761.1 Fpg/Nei family DNA glycosylase [Peribacillus glennii]
MPELPEMENYRLLLSEKITGRVITGVHINREKSINVSILLFCDKVMNQTVARIERRAKHLLFHLQNGRVLLLHLMLGGWIYFGREEDKPERTIKVQLCFGDHHLYFIGLRLGYLHLYDGDSARQQLSDLGPEPLNGDFTLDMFLKMTAGKRGRLKMKLVDQQFISGIGNCYSDEICFHAKVLPTRDMNDLAQPEITQLYHSIRFILQQAIKHGGYMENPVYKGDSITGGSDALCKVYDREGEKCSRCGAVIIKEIVSSRKVFYCGSCQK